jgi:hypothetical protein
MQPATEKQIAYIESLMAKLESYKPVAPKKVSRWNDPVKAHQQKLGYIAKFRADMAAGPVTKGWASTTIDTIQAWIK